MNYDEAVKVLDAMHSGAHATSEQMLDAIGYRQMTQRIDWNHRELTSLEDVVLRLGRERDAARTLADRLYNDVEEGCLYVNHNYDYTDDDPTRCKGCDAQAAYESRDWKPISPPGSGLDGLLADINRDQP